MGGWQPLNTLYYPDQTCPNQPQHQPHQQQSFKSTSEEDQHVNVAEEEREGMTALQQNVQVGTRSKTEMIMEMQHTYEEQQYNMGEMIRQVALLTVMIKEIQENRARSEVGEKVKENGMTAAESESESQQEVQTEEKSIITPSKDNEPQETLERVHNRSPEKDEEVIERKRGFDNAVSYLQTKRVHEPNKKGEGPTIIDSQENELVSRPPPKVDNPWGLAIKERMTRRKRRTGPGAVPREYSTGSRQSHGKTTRGGGPS